MMLCGVCWLLLVRISHVGCVGCVMRFVVCRCLFGFRLFASVDVFLFVVRCSSALVVVRCRLVLCVESCFVVLLCVMCCLLLLVVVLVCRGC